MPMNLTILRGSIKVGEEFEKLTVCGPLFRIGKKTFVVCSCSCGNFTVVAAGKLGRTKSCGCWRVQIALKMGKGNIRHGMDGTPLYRVWHNLKSRCNNPNDDSYPHYGERGITYCREWEEFDPFMKWALANGYRTGLQIDRKDTNGNYTPNNCRFVTARKNSNNKTNTIHLTAFNETKSLSEWTDDPRCKVNRHVLWRRLKSKKWTVEGAIVTPVTPRGSGRHQKFFK